MEIEKSMKIDKSMQIDIEKLTGMSESIQITKSDRKINANRNQRID